MGAQCERPCRLEDLEGERNGKREKGGKERRRRKRGGRGAVWGREVEDACRGRGRGRVDDGKGMRQKAVALSV